jgi:tetratricopeptide (TPR) repeat protein
MKRKLIYIFSLIVGLSTLWSCDFDTEIYTAIDMDNAFGSAQDIQNALNGAYRNVGYYPYRGNRVIAIGDMASDIAEADASTGHFVAINMWTFTDTSGELLDVWTYAYKVIDQSTRGINGALELLASENLPDGDDVKLKTAISQFYALRALAYFDLVNLFGLPYKVGGGNSQLGIVLVDKEPIEEFQQVSRSTVEETYAQILKDIASAKEYATGKLNQYYFNEAAIYALDARVKLYMHRYEDAITSAEKAIELRNSAGVSNETYVSMWRSTAITGEDIFTIVKSEDDNLSANALNTLYGSYEASVSEFTKTRFQPNDIRLNLIYEHEDYGVNHPGKYDGLPSSAAVGNIPVFRLSEMYLIIAEAEAILGNDLTAAQNALLYTAKRDTDITSISDLPATQNELLDFIEEERIREFFTEGHRFYDLRRTGAIASIAGDEQFKAANFVYPIPSEEINSGFGVTQNENWSDKLPK